MKNQFKNNLTVRDMRGDTPRRSRSTVAWDNALGCMILFVIFAIIVTAAYTFGYASGQSDPLRLERAR